MASTEEKKEPAVKRKRKVVRKRKKTAQQANSDGEPTEILEGQEKTVTETDIATARREPSYSETIAPVAEETSDGQPQTAPKKTAKRKPIKARQRKKKVAGAADSSASESTETDKDKEDAPPAAVDKSSNAIVADPPQAPEMPKQQSQEKGSELPREKAVDRHEPARSNRRGGRRRGRGRGDRDRPKGPDERAVPVPRKDSATSLVAGSAVSEKPVPASPEKETVAAEAEPHRRSRRGRRGGRGRRKDAGGKAGHASRTPARPVPEEDDLDLDLDLDEDDSPVSPGDVDREMVINVSGGDECRIAVLQDGRLEELFIERASSQSHVGNIYKGRVTNVEPSIQAVFVDFGHHKNGFLHVSDVQSQYFPDHDGNPEDVGRKVPRYNRPTIQKCFRRGQEVIVQVTKEGVGTKGPTLTTYLSIPGRFLVMMPGMSRHGVSRKIEDEGERRKMRDLMNELKLPPDMGFILRTAGLHRSKRDLQRDLNYLLRLWKTVVTRIKRMPAPTELYQESDLVTRTIRDVYTAEFKRVVVDDPGTAKKVTEFLQIAMPRTKASMELYTDREPLFHRMGIETEIERINMREVPLPLGGSLVIDSTEALVAIDVNSGRFRGIDDAEESALRINLEAAKEIARQLRLRDLGGLIVCDFIDMRLDRNKRSVERALRDALKAHKERARTLRMSAFGLIEMTRQRQGPSIKRNIYFDCPHCKGAGMVKMPESVVLDVMRIIQLATHREEVQKVTVRVASEVAFQILNNKRAALNEIEEQTGKLIAITGDPAFNSDQVEYLCEDGQGRPVAVPGAGGPEPSSKGSKVRNGSRVAR